MERNFFLGLFSKVAQGLSEKMDADASAADDRCGVDCLLEDVLRKATPQYKTDEEELCTERFLSTVHDDFQCPICKLVVDQAKEAPCCERRVLHCMHLAMASWGRYLPFMQTHAHNTTAETAIGHTTACSTTA